MIGVVSWVEEDLVMVMGKRTYVSGVVDEIVDAAMDFEGVLGDLLEVGEGGGYVQREGRGTGFLKV